MKDNVEIAVTAARLLVMLALAGDHTAALGPLRPRSEVALPVRRRKQRGLDSGGKANKYCYLKGNEPGVGAEEGIRGGGGGGVFYLPNLPVRLAAIPVLSL